MSQRILVRSRENTKWMLAFRVLWIVVLLADVVGVLPKSEPAWLWFAGGLAVAIIVESLHLTRALRRLWLEDQGDALLFTGFFGTRLITDAEVRQVALSLTAFSSNGERTGTVREFTLYTDAGEPARMSGFVPLGQTDPLNGVIERLLNRVLDSARTELKNGRSVQGPGWELREDRFDSNKPGREPRSLPIADISAVAEFDGDLCLWVRGVDEPAVRIPVNGPNTIVLERLLDEKLQQRPAKPEADTQGLGRVLFERKPRGRTLVLVFAVCAGVLGMLAGIGPFIGPPNVQKDKPDLFVFAFCCLAAAGGLWFWAHALGKSVFRCHANGVRKANLFGDKSLRYEHVRNFTYSAVRQFVNGAYTGTTISMTLQPIDARLPVISYTASIRDQDSGLEGLRDHISKLVAMRMAGELDKNGGVQWTDNLAFRKDGILYRPGGFLGRKDWVLLANADFGGYDLQQGVFHLFQRGVKSAVTTEEVSATNFFPGFVLLTAITDPGTPG